MAEKRSEQIYVAPDEPPVSRGKPITEIGVVKWLKDNLFSSIFDSIITILTLGVIVYLLYGILNWALFEAQWEIVFLNQAMLNTGQQFPTSEIWRVELAGFLIIFLVMLSVGVWGRVARVFAVILVVILAIMLIVPFVSTSVEEPTIYMYYESGYTIRQVNFIAHAGQNITFTIDPLTEVGDYEIDNIKGYIENDNQQSNTSFDAFNNRGTSVKTLGDVDPTIYDLNFAIQIWNSDGGIAVTSEFTQGTTETTTFEWEVPEDTGDGWYTFTMIPNEEVPHTAGAAFVLIDNVEVFRSTNQGRDERVDRYGEPPELDCAGCATATNRTDMRFEGKRTLAQWFSLQLSPYLLEIRGFFISTLIAGVIAYFIGQTAVKRSISIIGDDIIKRAGQFVLGISAMWFVGYLGTFVLKWFVQSPEVSTIQLAIFMAFATSIIIYAIIQFMRDDPAASSKAVTILWVISMPILVILLTGVSSPDSVADPRLPAIETGEIGGLLLTLLLSAVAIVASFPIGMALALGRRSNLPVVSGLSTIFIEVFRGVPLITLLFMGFLILPFFGFGLGDVDLMVRIMVVLTIFMSAYLAEVIRGGLQIVAKGQLEAAHALGLNDFWTTTLIVLPQALRAVIPAMMGQAVSLFKDTTLVYIVSLFEILGTMNQVLGDSQTGYIAFPREGYLYVGIVFFVFSYIMADVSRRIERTGSGAVRRDTI